MLGKCFLIFSLMITGYLPILFVRLIHKYVSNFTVFFYFCGLGANPCESLQCGPNQECDIDRYGIATCICPPACEPVMRPVCGDDGHTYHNDCDLHRKSCLQNRRVVLAYRGECGEYFFISFMCKLFSVICERNFIDILIRSILSLPVYINHP